MFDRAPLCLSFAASQRIHMKQDISSRPDVELLVNEFYAKVQKNQLIGPIFIGAIQDWQPHLEKMYTFWSSILLNENSYNGRPFPPHADMPLQIEHFETWLTLFRETVDEYFEGERADEAKMRAVKIAQIFLSKIEYLRSNTGQRAI